MRLNRHILPALCCVLLWSACTRETEQVNIDFGYEYFPLKVGRSWEYQVDSIIFDPAGSGTAIDSTRIWALETALDFFLDHAGDTIFRVERYERGDTGQVWQIRKVMALSRTAQQAQRTEDNLRFVKLGFPLSKHAAWNGARFIDPEQTVVVAGEILKMFNGWRSTVLEYGTAWNNGIMNFDDAVVVSHADSENLVEYRYVQEAYARGVGLVFAEQRILDTQCRVCCDSNFGQCAGIPWTVKAEKGFIVRQRLIRWE